jgi:hypothetical protein
MTEMLTKEGYVLLAVAFFGPSIIVLTIAGLIRLPAFFGRLQRARRRRRSRNNRGQLPNLMTKGGNREIQTY